MKRIIFLSTVFLFGLTVNSFAADNYQTKTVLSDVYTIDKIYKSMMGPQSFQEVYLGHPDIKELVWVTGFETVMVGEDGHTLMSEEYMCHSNLDFDLKTLKNIFPNLRSSVRAFTLSQGQLSVNFPEGFGIPIVSNVPLKLYTQVLNLNEAKPNLKVRHKVTLNYITETDTPKMMTPLFTSSAYGMKGITEGSHFYNQKSEMKGSGCLIGQSASEGSDFTDQQGQKFTGHWIVPPGREENHTSVTNIMAIRYDTTIHHIAVHMHPFAESLELLDKTTGTSLFKSHVENTPDKIGLKHVDYFSSKEGIPVYKDHEYELVSIYNNTSKEDQDSMAVMYLYLKDKYFSGITKVNAKEIK